MVIKMEYKITTNSEEDTIVLAQNFESEKFNNMVICLIGELGSGKTVFTKGFAGALGIEENITSPTFNIIKEYTSGEMNLYHMVRRISKKRWCCNNWMGRYDWIRIARRTFGN